MKKMYINPRVVIISLASESVIASSGGANATLPDGGYTPFESSKRESIWNDSGEELWKN